VPKTLLGVDLDRDFGLERDRENAGSGIENRGNLSTLFESQVFAL
jgi:hypothetical protein